MTTKQEFNCIFCKDVFENKEDLQEHFRKHGDPNYKTRSDLDAQASDDKSKEKVDMVSCDVCSQVFPTISKAITHKHKVHPDHDAKYFCPWCGKLFTMKHLYNIHVQTNHKTEEKIEDKSFRCESCSVNFFIPSAMINHNKFFHRQDTDLPDVGHSKKIKFYNQEIVQIFYCAFCGEEYENKINLIKHMSDDHEDENQSPDEVLKCPLCDAVFYHLDAYEIHLTFHSSEDIYSVKNPDYSDVLDYSLETVPPIIEKVENLETEDHNQDTDAESTMNAVGIEKFLELAMDQSDDSNPVKVKKHKKHKKSKKSAITLDEFLSMNKDVFGEGIDFQGIEEVPTRVVKKQLKNNKKVNTSVELEKLKKAGIVIKKIVDRKPVIKGIKIKNSGPNKIAQNKYFDKINPDREIKTSSEVLTKLMNQSNNQIKIVKKVNSNNAPTEPKLITKDILNDEFETSHENSVNFKEHNNSDEIKSSPVETDGSQDVTKDLSFPKLDKSSVIIAADHPLKTNLSEKDSNSDVGRQLTNNKENTKKISEQSGFDHSPKLGNNEKVTKANEENFTDTNELDPIDSDPEFKERENESDEEENDEHIDEIQTSSDKESKRDSKIGSSVSSLSTLKHLSHLITVKPVSQNKNTTSVEPTNCKITEIKDNHASQNANMKENSNLLASADKLNPIQTKNLVEKDPTLDALKTLSKNITIKSLSTMRNIEREVEEDSDIKDTEKISSNIPFQDVGSNKNITVKKLKIEMSEPKPDAIIINSINSQEKQIHTEPGKPLISKTAAKIMPTKVIVENTDNNLPTSNANILKRLTNITTKPILNKTTAKQTNIAKKVVQREEKKEEIIEIFDVDDSEDEIEKNSQNSIKSMDALKNLSKNITVKSMNQQYVQKNIKIENNIKIEKGDESSQSNFKDDLNVYNFINMQNRNTAYKNALQGLSKNITIKSRTSSPSQFLKFQEYNNTHDSELKEHHEEYDSDSSPENIKITELEEDEMDNNDDNPELTEKSYMNHKDPIVETPDECCSDKEETNENLHDFETDLKISMLQKNNRNLTISSACLDSLKNKNITIKSLNKSSTNKEDKNGQAQIDESSESQDNLKNKNITVKSLNKSSTNKEDNSGQTQIDESLEAQHCQTKQLPIKTSKQVTKDPPNENIMSINRTSTQSFNKKMSAMNQVNTINKEVTVKTFQTKTVIQEITTTVTKTIKTINQTTKQEVTNTFQTNSPKVTQRIQGMRPSQTKNLQGVVVRHASPILGARASNVVSQIRPVSTVVRPSKIVPMRPGMNLTRPNNPRMAVGKKVTPSQRPTNPAIGKPLKISPMAVAATIAKRPNTEEVSGPFSCFKKPKESLIPVSDIPTFTNSGGEVTAQFTAASHCSSSNVSSTTKIIKGNSVVTAKQKKTEVNATSQHLSRVCNTTAIKVMASQAKQTQVQEKSDTSAMKRTTLEAIQRLQKQGLLVKKPRVEDNEVSGDSDHDTDNIDYSSADDHNE